jgi:hypothetical protein
MRGVRALPASVAQREQIERINNVGNSHFRALVIGHRDGRLHFGLPGMEPVIWCPWPNR